MSYQAPLRREIKTQAKRMMLNLLSLRVTLVVVGAQMAFFFLRILCNGTLRLTMANLSAYGDTSSGFYVLDEGINVIFRMDLTGMVAAVSTAWVRAASAAFCRAARTCSCRRRLRRRRGDEKSRSRRTPPIKRKSKVLIRTVV